MDDRELLATRFEEHRGRLRAVAYRMLGSHAEAEDAVQETWLRVSRAGSDGVDNLGGWLTTIVSRVCLNLLRSRSTRREEPLDVHLPDPIITPVDAVDPEQETVLADSVGIALLVVLETLAPAERLAFVLHDLFGVPFDEIAPIVGRTPAAARQLASRARRRVQGAAPAPDPDPARRREVVDAFLAAARRGDMEALVAVLDPDVVVRTDGRPGGVLRGVSAVTQGAMAYARIAEVTVPAIVNGEPGGIGFADGQVLSIAAFTVVGNKIVLMDVITDPERLARLDLSAFRG